jgi:L-fuculose-phosphate aldolase
MKIRKSRFRARDDGAGIDGKAYRPAQLPGTIQRMVGAGESDEIRLRAAIVAGGRRLAARGLIAGGEGNLSVRLAGGRFLVTPAGRRKDELQPEELVIVDADGRQSPDATGLRPSSDLALHLAVYRARPDVVAYVHAHIPAAMALTLAGQVPDPAALPETALLLPRLPVVPLATPGSDALATALAAALTTPPEPFATAVLLERHGAVAVASGEPGAAASALATAIDRIELADVLCRVWRDALLLASGRVPDSG